MADIYSRLFNQSDFKSQIKFSAQSTNFFEDNREQKIETFLILKSQQNSMLHKSDVSSRIQNLEPKEFWVDFY